MSGFAIATPAPGFGEVAFRALAARRRRYVPAEEGADDAADIEKRLERVEMIRRLKASWSAVARGRLIVTFALRSRSGVRTLAIACDGDGRFSLEAYGSRPVGQLSAPRLAVRTAVTARLLEFVVERLLIDPRLKGA